MNNINSEEYSEIINLERIGRNVICINPDHDTIIVYTKIKLPKCPYCNNIMVHLVKPLIVNE